MDACLVGYYVSYMTHDMDAWCMTPDASHLVEDVLLYLLIAQQM